MEQLGNAACLPRPRRKQQQFSEAQKNFLMQFYDNTAHYPTPEEYALFAVRFNTTKRRVKTWFNNRRARYKNRSSVLPVRSKSESWNQGSTFQRFHISISPPPVLPQPNMWDLWEPTIQTQATNAVLWRNSPAFHQELPTFQGQGFIPSDLYEAQAWWKKQTKLESTLEKKITGL